MTGYASNPAANISGGSQFNGGGGFLARKGEALPAVDAQAHAGVDVETYEQHPSGFGIKAGHRRKARKKAEFTSLYRQPASRTVVARDQRNDEENTPPPTSREAWFANRKSKQVRLDRETMRAVVTFKMPITDFFRMRHASQELEMTCKAILLDAIDCYLEANEIDPISIEEARLKAASFSKRSARPAYSKPDVSTNENDVGEEPKKEVDDTQ